MRHPSRGTNRQPSCYQGESVTSDRRPKLIQTIRDQIATKDNETDILRTAAELIDNFSEDFNWTGFYMLRGSTLEIGPYVGPETPHTHIELNSGICGAAASQKRSVIVDDVNADPRFLACSLTTRSEIVVPLLEEDECIGEIDIDSNRPANFTDDDRKMLEEIATIIVDRLASATRR
ncbi:MAG: GAF domain-containing protein [candidate division Zixibacteria bacterium]|nr:GAF domain-containing protein [candidate division Zixibacteria bacterium]